MHSLFVGEEYWETFVNRMRISEKEEGSLTEKLEIL